MKIFYLLAIFSTILLIPVMDAEASSNPNLFVSAENSQFNNHFSGSMVVEVIIRDNNIRDTDEGKGEPDVTINGKILRMVQATDGQWYAYFANIDKAKNADSTVGSPGNGLDFGSICTVAEGAATIGIDLSDADGVAYPYDSCNGISDNSNNVVRKAKSPNPIIPEDAAPGSDGLGGQIGIVEDTWPFIQLFSFDDVIIQYNPGGPAQQVSLEYDEIPNISFSIDRDLYPNNSEVFLVVNDFQLNQDPTDQDSWTFGVGSTPSTFYQAYDNSGNNAANGNVGLVDLVPHLSSLGFEDNGELSFDLGNVMQLKTNRDQPDSSINDGPGSNTFSEIITLVEQVPNSGIFESYDSNDQSTIGILGNAPRGQAGTITYNQDSISVLTGFSTGSVSLSDPSLTIGSGGSLRPGVEYPVVLEDPDQNLNTGANDDLDVFRETAIIPTITIGNPITFENAQNVLFHLSSPTVTGGTTANSSVSDSNSDRLVIDPSTLNDPSFEMISVNLGVSASSLSSILLDVSESNTYGTNWINYDLRSFENDFDISDFSDTSFSLSFGTLGSSSITIVDAGEISSPKGFIQIDDLDVKDIAGESGTVFLVIDFDSSDDDSGVISLSSEINDQPIVFDFFSFGLKNNQSINNSIYRFELEETQDNSSIFEGSFEYAVTNQLNILDPNFIQTAQTIDDEIKIIVTDRLIDEEGITISYSDLDVTGVITTTSTKSDLPTHSGTVSITPTIFRFGQSVTIILNDSDLNLKSDTVEVYRTVNDPRSPIVDTVGKDGEILLEIKLRDIRYKRCTVDGVEHGGLASTGFVLVETGRNTGIFEGVFRIPSQICDKTGSKLISPAGGNLDARYYDSRDAYGNSNIFNLLHSQNPVSFYSPAKLSQEEVTLPRVGSVQEIILSGSIDNHKRGIPLSVTLTNPDGAVQNFGATLSNSGSYRSIFTVNPSSLPGQYFIDLSYENKNLETLSFSVVSETIPDWIKDNARWWSSNNISDNEFIDGIEDLIEKEIISVTPSERNTFEQEIPNWVKNNAKWWADEQISDEDFIKSIQYLVKKGIIQV